MTHVWHRHSCLCRRILSEGSTHRQECRRHNGPSFCYGDGLENKPMSIPPQPNIRLVNTPDYREGYANSVQVRVSVWDFLLIFGRVQPQATNEVEVQNFQGLYLSPQQAKALLTILEQNVAQYEKTFGEIKLDPAMSKAPGQIH